MAVLASLQGFVLHVSASTFGDAETIRHWHKGTNGWTDIGYHFVCCNGFRKKSDPYNLALDGKIELGRAANIQGAHCAAGSMNSCTLGWCFIGDPGKPQPSGPQYLSPGRPEDGRTINRIYMTRRQLASGVDGIARLCLRYELDPAGTFWYKGRSIPVITQHSDHDPTNRPLCASINLQIFRKAALNRFEELRASR